METLKKISAALVVAFILTSRAFSQDANLLTAFTNSYNLEYAGKYTDAIAAMEKVYNEKSYEANLRLGWLYYMAAQSGKAITYYQKAIALMPYAIEAKFGIVYPLAAMENWDGVVKQYADILKIAPENTTANYRMGLISYNREKFEDAKKYFDKYLNLFPFEYDAVIMSAWTQFKLGKMAEAKVLFNKALLLKPTDTSAKEGLSYIK